MENMSIDESIKKTATSFEESFLEGSYYNSQTCDNEHRSLMIKSLNINTGSKLLDLGTGNGYLAFPIAEQNPSCHVYGIDIAENTINRNNISSKEKKLRNLEFVLYDGKLYPFADNYFDVIVSRYALHHFPDIDQCFKELSRIVKPNGQLFISDPTPHEKDLNRFVDLYMQMKDDRHIKFYTLSEYMGLGKKYGFIKESNRMTKIRFPRKDPGKYASLLESTNMDILNEYEVKIKNDEIFITEEVLNISFIKR